MWRKVSSHRNVTAGQTEPSPRARTTAGGGGATAPPRGLLPSDSTFNLRAETAAPPGSLSPKLTGNSSSWAHLLTSLPSTATHPPAPVPASPPRAEPASPSSCSPPRVPPLTRSASPGTGGAPASGRCPPPSPWGCGP